MRCLIVFFMLLLTSCVIKNNDEAKPVGEKIKIKHAGKKNPLLGKFLKGKSSEYIYDTYAVIEKENYTFIFGIDQEFGISICQVVIYKDTILVNEFDPFSTGPFSEKEELDSIPRMPMPDSPNDTKMIYLTDVADYIEFVDFNEDGLFDFNLNYDQGGSMGSNYFIGYQNSDKIGFTQVMNSLSIFYDESAKMLYSHTRGGAYGSYTYGYNSKTLELEYVNQWDRLNDSIIFEVHKGDKVFTHLYMIQNENEIPWEIMENIQDSLVRLANRDCSVNSLCDMKEAE